jgi:hypothetical protein
VLDRIEKNFDHRMARQASAQAARNQVRPVVQIGAGERAGVLTEPIDGVGGMSQVEGKTSGREEKGAGGRPRDRGCLSVQVVQRVAPGGHSEPSDHITFESARRVTHPPQVTNLPHKDRRRDRLRYSAPVANLPHIDSHSFIKNSYLSLLLHLPILSGILVQETTMNPAEPNQALRHSVVVSTVLIPVVLIIGVGVTGPA